MANIKKFPQGPYYDDFDEDNNFLRLLFRPGYSVQTRELNQIQSVLQDQIGNLGDYALNNNTRVIGGETNLVKRMPYIKMANGFTHTYRDLLVGSVVQWVPSPGAEPLSARIISIENETDNDPFTLYVSYDTASGTIQTPPDNATLTFIVDIGDGTVSTTTGLSALTDSTGFASSIVLSEGVFYIDKSFIRTKRQVLLLNKYEPITHETEDISVGFMVESVIVRPEEDLSLLDNATGEPNETAPGAHRYKSSIRLIKRSDVNEDDIELYTELIRIAYGEIAAKPRIDNEFSVLEQTMARRTYDQSGDYIVDDFTLDVIDNPTDASKYTLKFDAGTAYIRGYEVRTDGIARVDIPKATTSKIRENSIIQTQYKCNLICDTIDGLPLTSSKIKFLNSASVEIGTGYTRSLNARGDGSYVLDLVNVRFNGKGSWGEIATAESASPNALDAYTFTGTVVDYNYNPGQASLLYQMPFDRVHEVEGVIPRVSSYNILMPSTANNNIIAISTDTSTHFNADPSSFVVYCDYNGGLTGTPKSVSLPINTPHSVTIDVENLTGTATPGIFNVYVFAKVTTNAPTAHRTKLRTIVSGESILPANFSESIKLANVDIFKLVSIKAVTSGDEIDVTDIFALDNGARDTFYDYGSLNLLPGQSIPECDNLSVSYEYFTHSSDGTYFNAASYTSGAGSAAIRYDEIPTYTTSAGDRMFLGSTLDFRQSVSSGGLTGRDNYEYSFVTNSQIVADVKYYLSRNDRLMLTNKGEFILVSGTPARNPQLPTEIDNAITLYNIHMKANTSSLDEIVITKVNHRRYTMKDISKLDKRISNVEEVALLSTLEKSVNDEDFIDKFKSGFVVDNFSSDLVGDYSNADFNIAFDLTKHEARPKNITTFLDSNIEQLGSNLCLHEDGTVTLAYTETPVISQPLASSESRVQPFASDISIGVMDMYPSSDMWFDTQAPVSSKISNNNGGSIWTNTNWLKRSQNFTFDDSVLTGIWDFVGTNWRSGTNNIDSEVQSSRLNSIASNKSGSANAEAAQAEVEPIPHIRSRVITFNAKNLKPGATVYPSFDGVDVSQYCTPSVLSVASDGTVSGTFTIPANKFKAGTRIFRLSDNPNVTGAPISTYTHFVYKVQGIYVPDVGETNSTISAFGNTSSPIAQTFVIDSSIAPNGTFISSIELFFNNIPKRSNGVTIELRKINNGVPAISAVSDKAIAYVKGADLVPTRTVDGSINMASTTFTFKSPIHIYPDEEYAVVIISESEDLTVWCSELGKRSFSEGDVLQPTGTIISKQPYLGNLLISQNNDMWVNDKLKDIKFVINRCKFNTSTTGLIDYVCGVPTKQLSTASNIFKRTLKSNPLYFTKAEVESDPADQPINRVGLEIWGHSLVNGNKIVLSTTSNNASYYGVPKGELFGKELTVISDNKNVNMVYFDLPKGTFANTTGRAGGPTVTVDILPVGYSYVQLLSDEFTPNLTRTSYTLTARRKMNNTTASFNLNKSELNDLGDMYVVRNNTARDCRVRSVLESSDNNLSPIINTYRHGLVVASNVISNEPIVLPNPDAEEGNDLIPKFIRNDKASPSRYVQKQVTLVAPANEIRAFVDANIPLGATINAYYKVCQTDTTNVPIWKKMSIVDSLKYSDDTTTFKTQEFVANLTNECQVFSVMIELLSDSPVRIPRFRDYRAIALNGL